MDDEDPISELARFLREGAGEDLRSEAEITEIETHIARLRNRSLADLARQAMHRGDELTVVAHGRSARGLPVFVGTDYLILETADNLIDVRLERVVLTVTRRPAGGRSGTGGSATLKARLSEYEQTKEPVRLVAGDIAEDISCSIEVVAADHVVCRTDDGQDVVVPLPAISLVIRPLQPNR